MAGLAPYWTSVSGTLPSALASLATTCLRHPHLTTPPPPFTPSIPATTCAKARTSDSPPSAPLTPPPPPSLPQIEHHLYPRLPRHNLRKARTLVRAVCAKHGIPYHEPGFFQANLETLASLRCAAMDARKACRDPKHGFYASGLWDAMNASG